MQVPVLKTEKNRGELGVVTPLIKKQIGAGNQVRTGDLYLGKVPLYQLSYSRFTEAKGALP